MANELRLRANSIGGRVSNGPLTASGTTLTSAGLAGLPEVGSASHMALVLDPHGEAGEPEIVWVTAHTAGSSSVTIVRAKEFTTARSHEQDTFWYHTATAADYPVIRAQEGPNGATRASSTYGALSTPWTVTIPVVDGQIVDLEATIALTSSTDAIAFVAFRRGSTTIYENVHYTDQISTFTNVLTHRWQDTSPGSGDVIYEVYLASSGTLTLRNGATLDTTTEQTQGKSILIASARFK